MFNGTCFLAVDTLTFWRISFWVLHSWSFIHLTGLDSLHWLFGSWSQEADPNWSIPLYYNWSLVKSPLKAGGVFYWLADTSERQSSEMEKMKKMKEWINGHNRLMLFLTLMPHTASVSVMCTVYIFLYLILDLRQCHRQVSIKLFHPEHTLA